MSDVPQRVVNIVAESQQLDPATITLDSTFEQLGIDSFDGVSLLFAIESEFDIHVSDDDAKALRGIRDIAEGVEKLLARKGAAAQP